MQKTRLASILIEPLQPRLVYLATTDPRAILEKVRQERSQEWVDFVTAYLTSREYGRAHGLEGFEGVIRFYTLRQALAFDLIKMLPISSIIVSDKADWRDRYQNIADFCSAGKI